MSTVDSAACHSVNQATSRSAASASTSPIGDEVERAVGAEAPADDRAERATRRRRRGRRAARAASDALTRSAARASSRHRSTVVGPLARSSASRFAPIVARRERRADRSGTSANFVEHRRQRRVVPHREHEHLQRDVRLERLGEHEVDELACRGRVLGAPQDAGELDLAEAARRASCPIGDVVGRGSE